MHQTRENELETNMNPDSPGHDKDWLVLRPLIQVRLTIYISSATHFQSPSLGIIIKFTALARNNKRGGWGPGPSGGGAEKGGGEGA